LKSALGHENALLGSKENLRLDGKYVVYRRLGQESSGKWDKGVNLRAPTRSVAAYDVSNGNVERGSDVISADTLVTKPASFTSNGATDVDGLNVV
jgi:hypothetical protein